MSIVDKRRLLFGALVALTIIAGCGRTDAPAAGDLVGAWRGTSASPEHTGLPTKSWLVLQPDGHFWAQGLCDDSSPAGVLVWSGSGQWSIGNKDGKAILDLAFAKTTRTHLEYFKDMQLRKHGGIVQIVDRWSEAGQTTFIRTTEVPPNPEDNGEAGSERADP